MAIIDVVKFDALDQIVWKFPSENLRLGTQLIVRTGQVAFFVRGGKVLDKFEPGTHTLTSANIPLLGKLISLPFGGDTPFQAEMWFVNLTTRLDCNWGTLTPLQIEDPKYGVVVPIRAYGQYGIYVSNPLLFLQKIVGTQKVVTKDNLEELFKGILLQAITSNIGKALVKENINVFQLVAYTQEISQFCKEVAGNEFNLYGLELANLKFISINIPEDDPSYIKLKQIKEKSTELNIVGKDIYAFDKSMDVLKTAAANEGGGNSLMQAGMGLGVGLNLGNQVGQQFGNMVTQVSTPPPSPPPIPPSTAGRYYLAINGEQSGPFDINALKAMILSGSFNKDTLVWKEGMVSWTPASTMIDLVSIFVAGPPPIPPR